MRLRGATDPGLSLLRMTSLFLCAVALMGTVFLMGCGSVINPYSSPSTGNTAVTLLATSTANDRLSQYVIEFLGITLTSQSGKTVNLLGPLRTGPYNEFMHLNGSAEPLATASIPQDTYSAATVTVGSAGFACLSLDAAGGVDDSNWSFQVPFQATVNMAGPITISGTAMGLSLNLLVSKSATYPVCDPMGPPQPFTVTPTFNLNPVSFSPQLMESIPLTGLLGMIASVDSNSVTVTGADGPVWTASFSATTVFQGVAGGAALAVGMPVEMDATIQPDGSLLATRVGVDDATPAGLTVTSGPVTSIPASVPAFYMVGQEEQGYLYEMGGIGGSQPFNFTNTVYQLSGALSNLESLPFTASFTAANMVPGQNASVTTHAFQPEGPPYDAATTVTLVPQTINGIVSAIANTGGFTVYTVTLPAYDLLPNLAVQPGQVNKLAHPGTVMVYADGNARMLNENAIAVGSIVRFRGLLFNDNGALKMDCSQVNDGVTE
jgi:Domain of unknown function (DUF5666)